MNLFDFKDNNNNINSSKLQILFLINNNLDYATLVPVQTLPTTKLELEPSAMHYYDNPSSYMLTPSSYDLNHPIEKTNIDLVSSNPRQSSSSTAATPVANESSW